MKELEQFISPLIETQFPSFYNEEGPNFIAFVKAYYEWMEENGNPLNLSRNTMKYNDIDTTLDSFLNHFKNQYLVNFPLITSSSTDFIIKHIKDYYLSKGSAEALKLLFLLVFGKDAEVYIPNQHILRPSDGIWVLPEYIELDIGDKAITYVNTIIYGATSGASAFVEGYIRKRIAGRFIDVLFISRRDGNFKRGELITNSDGSLTGTPMIVGSLSEIEIIDGGANNKIGSLFNISGPTGVDGIARVTATVDGTGRVFFKLIDGGVGYSNTANVFVSNVTAAFVNTSSSPFQLLEYILQPLTDYPYVNLLGANTFTVGQQVYGVNSSAGVVANGFIVNSYTTNSTSGGVVISRLNGDFTSSVKILTTNNSINAQVNSISSQIDASGMFIGANTFALGLVNISNTFYSHGAYIVGYSSNTYANLSAIGTGAGATFSIGDISPIENAPLGTDYFAEFNTGNIQFISYPSNGTINSYTSIRLSGTNSNVVTNAYGFPSNPSGNLNSTIYSCLGTNTYTLGTITSIKHQNPSNNYNLAPLVLIVEPFLAGFDKRDYLLNTVNTSGVFAPGQLLFQTNPVTSLTARGVVKTSSPGYITAQRLSFNDFIANTTNASAILSTTAPGGGAQLGISYISQVTPDLTTLPIGENASVTSNVSTANGIATSLQILFSGYGYIDGDTLTLYSANNPIDIVGTANVSHQGIGLGYWRNTQGQLNADQFIHDNEIYQEFSYVVQSSLSLDRYADMLRGLFHPSGFMMSGEVVSESVVSLPPTGTPPYSNAYLYVNAAPSTLIVTYPSGTPIPPPPTPTPNANPEYLMLPFSWKQGLPPPFAAPRNINSTPVAINPPFWTNYTGANSSGGFLGNTPYFQVNTTPTAAGNTEVYYLSTSPYIITTPVTNSNPAPLYNSYFWFDTISPITNWAPGDGISLSFQVQQSGNGVAVSNASAIISISLISLGTTSPLNTITSGGNYSNGGTQHSVSLGYGNVNYTVSYGNVVISNTTNTVYDAGAVVLYELPVSNDLVTVNMSFPLQPMVNTDTFSVLFEIIEPFHPYDDVSVTSVQISNIHTGIVYGATLPTDIMAYSVPYPIEFSNNFEKSTFGSYYYYDHQGSPNDNVKFSILLNNTAMGTLTVEPGNTYTYSSNTWTANTGDSIIMLNTSNNNPSMGWLSLFSGTLVAKIL